ncbi:MAG: AAA family ATPase [Deltaproteobacteria bacterium]|jgi:hypothetical protein|nr:AAA family ATPase [Deltaproteobacteria bacterium]
MIVRYNDLASSAQTFEEIIEKKSVYVDKTSYLAKLLSNNIKVWFLARPRCFGKTLTVSTLEAVFSAEKRELFRGLDIYSRLNEARFAPRPVIRLDMSELTVDGGLEELKRSLGEMIVKIAAKQDLTLDPSLPPKSLLVQLIERTAENSKRKVAILIDDYDAPFLAFMDRSSEERENLFESMCFFYKAFKSLDRYISFIFVTGIANKLHFEFSAVLNTIYDISSEPLFGAMCGFTQAELEDKFAHDLKRTAATLKMTEKELVAKMADYYYGFSFDGRTRLYNPFSTLLFFQKQEFKNYWYDTGNHAYLADSLKKNRLTVEGFRGLVVDEDFAEIPVELSNDDPSCYLYQAGYLTLRPGLKDDEFTLDYSNREVLESLSDLWVRNILDAKLASKLYLDLKNGLDNGDAPLVIANLNTLLAKIPDDALDAARKEDQLEKTAWEDVRRAERKRETNQREDKKRWGNFLESLYRQAFFALFRGAGLDVSGEAHRNLDRPDLMARREKWAWMLEIIVNQDEEDKEIETLKNARTRMIEKRYAAGHQSAICLGIVINDQKKTIANWANFGDLAKEYMAIQNRSPEESPKSESTKD